MLIICINGVASGVIDLHGDGSLLADVPCLLERGFGLLFGLHQLTDVVVENQNFDGFSICVRDRIEVGLNPHGLFMQAVIRQIVEYGRSLYPVALQCFSKVFNYSGSD